MSDCLIDRGPVEPDRGKDGYIIIADVCQ